MPKTRFNSSDVRAMVRDLRGLALGLRVLNVYDVDSKTYLIKLANPGQEGGNKLVLLLESGIRFHSTRFDRDKADMPSGFSMKLRKHVRAKRLEDISQLGRDRVVDFRFGSGENCNHIILEMYAGGNIVLTDKNYEILALLRTHKFEEGVVTAVKELYPIEHATTLVQAAGERAEAAPGTLSAASCPEEAMVWLERYVAEASAQAAEAGEGAKKKDKKKFTLKVALQSGGASDLAQYGADVITHVLLAAGLEPGRKLVSGAGGGLERDECASLVRSFSEALRVYDSLDAPGQNGLILCNGTVTMDDGSKRPKYDDVVPVALLQHAAVAEQLSFGSFDEAVDEFFAKAEEQRLASSADSAEQSIKNRVEKIRADQEQRLVALEAAQGEKRGRASGAALCESL